MVFQNCACYCKDTHFEAIHNFDFCVDFRLCIVLATAKIHILKQFTTLLICLSRSTYCACYCKDTHFEAIHNSVKKQMRPASIVLATAKIHILKQFTTDRLQYHRKKNCACYCKDTHFEAIHNHQTDDFVNLNSCFDFWSVLPAALQIYSWLSVECVVGCCVERIGLLRRDDRLPNP